MYCKECGKEINNFAIYCIYCGCPVTQQSEISNEQSDTTIANSDTDRRVIRSNKCWRIALILCIFGGFLGLHRFYTHYTRIGFLQLISCGGFFIWWIADLIAICLHSYKCVNGEKLV